MNGIAAKGRLINEYLTRLKDPVLKELCGMVLENKAFAYTYGSAGDHHAYEGGLAVHTFEVVQNAVNIANGFPQADMDVVITAAIFHDFMKIKDYNGPNKTIYRSIIRHVSGSHAAFLVMLQGTGKSISEEKALRIEHAILAHHGRYEWGSPVEPQLIEAYIVHFADVMSQKFGAGTKQ